MANKAKIKAAEVPSFFKKKVFMVTMMLICSGVLVVTATYAWFILATAPEVTGITTTVGSNGSLEMALLNGETFENTTLIQANVGDSLDTDGKAKTEANITWGNLVDLSDPSYGLSSITLNPALLNETDNKVDVTQLLSIAHNGTDGRITTVTADTRAASFNGTSFSTADSTYGVRAVGKVGGTSGGRLDSFNSAKAAYTSNLNTAKSTAGNVIATNSSVLLDMVTGGSSTYTVAQVQAMKSLADGLYNSLNYVFSAYKNAILAAAAATSDSAYNSVKNGIGSTTDVSLSSYATYFAAVGISSSDLTTLSTAMSSALSASNAANALLTDSDGEQVDDSTTYTAAQISAIKTAICTGADIDIDNFTITGDTTNGLATVVASYVGAYSASSSGFTVVFKTTVNSGSGLLAKVDLSKLTAPAAEVTTTTTNVTMTTFYGYVVDLAFRTNAAADLQLQSEAINRVYTDGGSGTAGGGSKVIFSYTEGMTATQINSMLGSVRVVFFDPESGAIYGRGKLGTAEINEASMTATATLYLMDDSGAAKVAANAALTTLEVATPKKISTLVYLDGTSIDNMSVMNATSSGTMILNLQFSSSADLKPMEDSELKNAS